MLVILTLLFILLQPGMLLTLPPVTKLWMSEETSALAVFVHAVLFFVVVKFASLGYFPFNYLNDLETQIIGSDAEVSASKSS